MYWYHLGHHQFKQGEFMLANSKKGKQCYQETHLQLSLFLFTQTHAQLIHLPLFGT